MKSKTKVKVDPNHKVKKQPRSDKHKGKAKGKLVQNQSEKNKTVKSMAGAKRTRRLKSVQKDPSQESVSNLFWESRIIINMHLIVQSKEEEKNDDFHKKRNLKRTD